MNTLEVVRDHMDNTPTTGEMLIEGEHFAYTLERPWLHNAPNVSCIPEGTYFLKLLYSPHFGRPLPHVLGVPGRSGILFHALNVVSQSQGCVGLGDERGDGNTILDSQHALGRFLEWFASMGNESEVTFTNGESNG